MYVSIYMSVFLSVYLPNFLFICLPVDSQTFIPKTSLKEMTHATITTYSCQNTSSVRTSLSYSLCLSVLLTHCPLRLQGIVILHLQHVRANSLLLLPCNLILTYSLQMNKISKGAAFYHHHHHHPFQSSFQFTRRPLPPPTSFPSLASFSILRLPLCSPIIISGRERGAPRRQGGAGRRGNQSATHRNII